MPRYYPIFLDVQARKAIVFGGDHEAERKVRYLVECGANVTLVGPESELTSGLQELATCGSIDWLPRGYRPGDLEGAWLAIVADTSDDETNPRDMRRGPRPERRTKRHGCDKPLHVHRPRHRST